MYFKGLSEKISLYLDLRTTLLFLTGCVADTENGLQGDTFMCFWVPNPWQPQPAAGKEAFGYGIHVSWVQRGTKGFVHPFKLLNLEGFGHLAGGQASLWVVHVVSLKTFGDNEKILKIIFQFPEARQISTWRTGMRTSCL